MIVELTPAQRDLVLRLVDEALEGIGPELHHTRFPTFRESLKNERRELLNLRALLSDVPTLDSGIDTRPDAVASA